MIVIMVYKPLKPRFAGTIEVDKHLLTNGLSVVKEVVRWILFSFFAGYFNRCESLNVC